MWLTSDHGVIQAEKGNIFEKVYRRKERERERIHTVRSSISGRKTLFNDKEDLAALPASQL